MSYPVTALIVAAAIALLVLGLYNGIISQANAAKRAWADVITYERGKGKVLAPITEMLGKYAEYESGLLRQITSLREQLAKLSDTSSAAELIEVQGATSDLLKSFKLTVENYPELKASHLYQQVMAEISDQQANVNAAVAIFNMNVESHNNAIQTFPGSLVNAWLNKRAAITPFEDAAASAEFEYKPNL